MIFSVLRVMGVALLLGSPIRAETPEEWVAFGIRVHGGSGSFIPIGEDALRRLDAGRREVTLDDSSGANAPCPCVADGIAIAMQASAKVHVEQHWKTRRLEVWAGQ